MNQARPSNAVPSPHGGPPPNIPSRGSEPDPRERIARFAALTRRAMGYWATALLLLAIGIALALGVALKVKRVYKSECVVLFKPGMNHSSDEPVSERALRLAPKLKEMLITRQRLEPLISEFHLYQKIVDSRGMLDAVEEMRNHIGFRGRDSETFVIAFDADDAEVTQKVTQRLADTMIDEFSRGNVSASTKQMEFLAVEMKRSDDDLETANKALATFLAGHPEFAASANQAGQGAAGMMIPAAAISAAAKGAGGDAQLSSLIQQRARIEAEAASAAGQPTTVAPPADLVAKIDALTKAREEALQRAALAQADLAEKKAKYTDQHPDLIGARQAADSAGKGLQAADAALAAAKAQMPQVVPVAPANMSPELRARLDGVNAQIAARQSELRNTAKAAAIAAPGSTAAALPGIIELETEWQRLLRTVREGRSAHEDIKTKYDRAKLQASAIAGTGGDQMEVLDPAFLPTKPSKGGRTNAALAGFAVALVVAVLYAYGRVVFSDTLVDAGDINALQLIPVLGVMPKIALSPSGSPGVVPGGADPRSGDAPRGGSAGGV